MISRIHTYAGLLTFANLILYGIVGMAALFDTRGTHASTRESAQESTQESTQATEVWEQPFAREPNQTDRETAERVVNLLGLSLATPVHDFNIGRDAQHRLSLDFYHANGRQKITVLENPGRIHIERTRASLSRYLSTLHVTTGAFHSGDWRMQLWAWWNEFAMWCLLAMIGSGVWIWLARRPARGTWRSVHRYSALSMLALLAIYEVSALHMAHRTWVKAGTGPAWAVLAWLDRVHRMRGVSLAPVLGVGLLALGASGMYLWWTLGRERRTGAAMLAVGLTFAGVLAVWMRMG